MGNIFKVTVLILSSAVLTIGCAAVENWNESAKKQQAELAEKNRLKAMAKIELVHQKLRPVPSGVFKAPKGVGDDLVKERIAQYCKANSFNAWEVVEIKATKEYQGNKTSGFANCSGITCIGGNRSNAVYESFDEVSFECKGS